MSSFFRKLSWLFIRRNKEAELREEIEFHLREEAEERTTAGMANDQARLAARRELGNFTRVQEDTRAAWTWALFEDFLRDLRYGFRSMIANRTFSALAILSLALGIGANTAIFSFMDSILLRSLPVSHPESLVSLSGHTNEAEVHGTDRHDVCYLDPKGGFHSGVMAFPTLELFTKNDSIFSAVFGYQGAGDLHLTIGNEAQMAATEYVTGNYFQALGVPPAAGRLLMPDDDRFGAPPVAVVSFALSRRFAGPAAAIGQSILIDRVPFRIIGVAPPEFFGADPTAHPAIYVPLHANLLLELHDYHRADAAFVDPDYEWVVPMARLQPGVSLERAQAVLAPQFSEWMRTVNTARTRTDLPVLQVQEARGGLDGLRRAYSKPLFILITLAGLILAIACANIANLLLARAAARKREIAVRLSIGAGRFRIVRQLLTESMMLASIGGAAGIAFAFWPSGFSRCCWPTDATISRFTPR